MDFRETLQRFSLIALLTFSSVQFISGQCTGSNCCGHGCCAGFMLDLNTSSCIPCDTGYIGKHCEILCPFPMFGDGCQFRCDCDNSSCSPLIGCRSASTTLQDERMLTNQNDLTLNVSPPPTTESNIKVNTSSAKIREIVIEGQTNEYHTRIRIPHSLVTNTKEVPRKGEKDTDSLAIGAGSALLIGIFAFNAFFVIIVFTLVLYCGCRKYRKYRKRKKDNSATVIHYHEIDDSIAGPCMDYDPLYTAGVAEMKHVLVEYENEPLNRERKSVINIDSRKRQSDTSPKQLARPSELVLDQTHIQEG
ncbi:uncharacterized protein LOC134282297 [Saccostrea cucullata]|uniref:uncharacterized protein LOC134282297 n=1 Tax=Saccostrea cuccullata TaxID=36930 RepID=UPI002ED0E584